MRSAIARMSKTIGELKRRKVFRVGSLYLVTIWGLSLGAAELLPTFGVPEWGVRYLVIALFLGFPVALILAWAFEVSPDGVVIDAGPDARPNGDFDLDAATTVFAPGRPGLNITWQEGDKTVSRIFNKNLTIGRHPDSDICITDASVSRAHVQISFIGKSWVIKDLGSRNGTLLNGALIEQIDLPSRAEVQLSDEGPAIIIENADASLAETEILPKGNRP